jgi:hypothetical protein
MLAVTGPGARNWGTKTLFLFAILLAAGTVINYFLLPEASCFDCPLGTNSFHRPKAEPLTSLMRCSRQRLPHARCVLMSPSLKEREKSTTELQASNCSFPIHLRIFTSSMWPFRTDNGRVGLLNVTVSRALEKENCRCWLTSFPSR